MARVKRSTRNINWIETYCRIPDGAHVGKPVKLRPFQKQIIKGIYGTPTRRAIVSLGRKNAKTALSSFLLLLHLCGPEARRNSQLYSAAQSKEQAAVLFELAAKIVRMSPDLAECVGIRDNNKHLYCTELGTIYKALSAEASTALGLSPVFVVHDELGQVVGPRSKLYEALETASGAHENPLSIVISTQASTDADLLSLLIDDAKTGADPKQKLFMWSAPDDADPFSLAAIKAANPALGDFLNRDEVLSVAEAARRMPSQEAGYRNLHLNQRVNRANPMIPKAVWMDCAGPADKKALYGGVYAGLDLSQRQDLTALVYGAQKDGVWQVFCDFFAPEDGLHERAHRDRVPYDLWARDGWLTLTPGKSVDYAFVVHRLLELQTEYGIEMLHYDRWRIQELKDLLSREGYELPLEPHGQGYRDMSPSIDNFENDLINGRIRHGNNPILNWCASNAVAVKDPAGNRKVDKSKSTGRIDGLVAMIMAFGPIKQATTTGDIDGFLRFANELL